MQFLENLLTVLDTQMETPLPYGWFHLLFFALSILAAIALCVTHKHAGPDRVRKVVLWVSIACILLEIYKQINYSFTVTESGIAFDYQWYAFPWQFCSTPMYIGLVAGLTKKGKLHDATCAYLATFSMFAGLAVMFYPVSVFIGTVGINIQTMICHGSMITLGIYLLYSGHVKLEHKTILKAVCVFAVMIGIAIIMNEIAHASGLLETETFNMFFISPYCEPSLPVYSLVQNAVAFPLCLVLYIAGFTLAAYLILLVAMGIRRIRLNSQRSHRRLPKAVALGAAQRI